MTAPNGRPSAKALLSVFRRIGYATLAVALVSRAVLPQQLPSVRPLGPVTSASPAGLLGFIHHANHGGLRDIARHHSQQERDDQDHRELDQDGPEIDRRFAIQLID